MPLSRSMPVLLLLAVLALASCTVPISNPPPTVGARPPAIESPVVTGTQPIEALASSPAVGTTQSPTPLSPGSANTPPTGQNTRYILSATFDYARHHLDVEQTIHYGNRSAEALPDLLLMVEPAYYPGVFQLKGLAWEDGQAVEEALWERTRLRLPLRQPLQPGEQIGLSIAYELNLPSPEPSPFTRPVPFGYTARQSNLVDWYPFIPPYRAGEGWLAHDQGYFGEHLVYEVADFQVEVRLTQPSFGSQPITLAASAPVEQEGQVYRFQLESARNFAWSASHDYQVTTATVGSVTVLGYAFPLHARAGEAAVHTTAQALELYQQIFGPYPRSTLSVVEADFLDGMEYEGLYFLSNGFYNLYQGTPGELLVAIAAHETAHQWWYGLVGNDQAMEPWLDEALCTYSERIFYENVYPEALDWWWAYRVKYYEPRGWVDGSIYNPEGYRAYRDAVYLNGAVFLEELRQEIGDEAFFAALQDYAGQYSHRLATGKDFLKVLSAHTEADLSGLLKKYFQN